MMIVATRNTMGPVQVTADIRCSYCNKYMGPTMNTIGSTSHGACEPCAAAVLSEYRNSLLYPHPSTGSRWSDLQATDLSTSKQEVTV